MTTFVAVARARNVTGERSRAARIPDTSVRIRAAGHAKGHARRPKRRRTANPKPPPTMLYFVAEVVCAPARGRRLHGCGTSAGTVRKGKKANKNARAVCSYQTRGVLLMRRRWKHRHE